MSNKTSIMLLVFTGIIFGLWSILSKGTFFIILSAGIIFFILRHFIPSEDRPFIFKVIAIGLLFRIILTIIYYYFYLGLGRADILGPDGEINSLFGWHISKILLDQDPYTVPNTAEYIFKNWGNTIESLGHKLPPMHSYQIGAFSYLLGILYSIFNYSSFLMKLINSLFSIFTGILIYFIGKEAFNPKVGKISMALFIFTPSIFIFSITSLRDPIIIFLLTIIVWLIMKFKNERNLLWLILIIFPTLALGYLRFRLVYLVAATIPSILLFWKINILRKMIFVMPIFLIFLLSPTCKKEVKHVLDPDNLFSGHVGYVNTPGNSYKIFPDRCYYQNQLTGIGPAEITMAFIKGIFHLLYEPLPQRIIRMNSKTLFFAFGQAILLYLFIPFIILGLCIGIRYRFYQTMPLIIWLIIFAAMIAINEGNVGTVFRHRDMIMPFLVIFGIVGYYAKLLRK